MSGCEEYLSPPKKDGTTTPQSQRSLDWENPNAIWSTPLENLPPPPSGPFAVTHSESSWEASLPFRAPMYPNLPDPTLEFAQVKGGEESSDPHAEEKPIASPPETIKSGSHTPPQLITASPLATNSPWSSYTSAGISQSPYSTYDSYSRSSTAYTESPASTFDSQRKRKISIGEEIHEIDPDFKAVFVTDRSNGATVHVLRGQTWKKDHKMSTKGWKRHQSTVEGTVTMKLEKDMKEEEHSGTEESK